MKQPLINKGFGGWSQLGIFLVLLGAGMMIASLLTVGIWRLATGQSALSMATDMLKPEYSNLLKVIQGVATVFIMFLPAVIYAFICYGNGWQALSFGKKPILNLLLLSIAMLLVAAPLVDALSELNKVLPIPADWRLRFEKMESDYEAQVKVMASVKSFPQFLSAVLLVAILPGIFEEVLFRGGMQNMLERWWKSPIAALIVTSIVFSAIHGSWFGFIPRFALGILLGSVLLATRNIWYSIIIHTLNNLFIVCYMYYQHLQGKEANLTQQTSFPWWAGVLSAAAVYLLYLQLKKQAREEVPREIIYDRINPFDKRDEVA